MKQMVLIIHLKNGKIIHFLSALFIGIRTGFSVNPGKFGKYYQRYLEPDLWEMLTKTFAGGDIEHSWEALFTMCDLFRTVAVQVADHFGYNYLHEYDKNVSSHQWHVRDLPRDAREMYS